MDRPPRLTHALADQRETRAARAPATPLRSDMQLQAALARIPAALVDFPQVPMTDLQRLPVFCAVYLFVKGHATVLYVGVTKNLRERVRTHHRWRDVCEAGATHLAWLPQEDVWIGREIERHCIKRYTPRLNGFWNSSPTGGQHPVRLMSDERALVDAFAAQLTQRDASRDYSTADATRIAALRYLRGALFPPQGEAGAHHE